MSSTAYINPANPYQNAISNNKYHEPETYTEGDFINATVISMKEGKTKFLTGDNKTFETTTKGFTFNIGDSVSFKVTGQKNNRLRLKMMESQTVGDALPSSRMSSADLMELFKQNNMASDENLFEVKSVWEPASEEDEALAKALSAIKNRLSSLSDHLSTSVVNSLLAKGVSIQKLSLHLVEVAVKKASQEVQPLTDEEINQITLENLALYDLDAKDMEDKEDIAAALVKNGLPVTENNVAALLKAQSTFRELKNMKEESVLSLLSGGKDLNLKNLYFARFTPAKNPAASTEDETENDSPLAPQDETILKHFNAQGIEASKENIAAAKIFVQNDVPVTKRNLELFHYFKNIGDIDEIEILDQGAISLRDGENPLEMALGPVENSSGAEELSQYEDAVKQLTDHDIAIAEKLNIPVTLYNLRTISHNHLRYQDLSVNVSDANINHRLTLLQIQLRLTGEAAARLVNKGIEIDTLPLLDALNTLKDSENEALGEVLDLSGAASTAENRQKASGILDHLPKFNPVGADVYLDIIHKMKPFTMDTIAASGKKAMEAGYEVFMTAPNLKYGDSFAKVTDGFAELLDSLKIEASKENIRASAILSRNQMDVNEENILLIKTIDEKLARINDTLHPAIAADMVKEGVNPLNMHVDEVIEYIEGYEAKYGEGLKDKIPEYIMNLEKSSHLSSQDKKAMRAVYRLLNQIEKFGGAAIGTNIKSGQTPTLKNLLDASKYYKKTGGTALYQDIAVDDDFGLVSERKINEVSIREILENSIHAPSDHNIKKAADLAEYMETTGSHELNLAFYYELLLKKAGDHLDPEILSKLKSTTADEILDLPLEELTRLLSENDDGTATAKRANEVYKNLVSELLSIAPETIAWMEEMEIPVTLKNMLPSQRLLRDSAFPYKQAGEILEKTVILSEEPLDFVPSEENYVAESEKIADELLNAFPQSEEVNQGLLREINLIQTGIKIKNAVKDTDTQHDYRLPVRINGKTGTLNMYLLSALDESQSDVTMVLSLHTDLGDFKGFFHLDEENNVYLQMDEQEKMNPLLKNEKAILMIKEHLNTAGFTAAISGYEQINQNSESETAKKPKQDDGIKTRMFKIATAVAKALGEIERNITLDA